MKDGKTPWFLIYSVLAAFLVLGLMKLFLETGVSKIAKEVQENTGKLMFYEVQKVEALKQVSRIDIIIDSLETRKDSVISQQLNDLTGAELQEQLNQIFNTLNTSQK